MEKKKVKKIERRKYVRKLCPSTAFDLDDPLSVEKLFDGDVFSISWDINLG